MHMADNGKEATFEGHVHSVMLPTGSTPAASPAPPKDAVSEAKP